PPSPHHPQTLFFVSVFITKASGENGAAFVLFAVDSRYPAALLSLPVPAVACEATPGPFHVRSLLVTTLSENA
ncbi:MAG: hypothetical protein ACYSVY_24435, partial [Planctomycetota bacterium]